jgi:hypothetical protein
LDHCRKSYSGKLPMVRKRGKINEIEVTDMLKAMVAPVRQY